MKNIEALLSTIPNLSGDELEEALDELCSFVKEYESEEEIKPVERALPSLCKHLLYDGPHLNMHFMVSIFRRVHINQATIRKIISLHQQSPNNQLIGVLYSLTPENFTESVQDFLISNLDNFPEDAVYAFRGNCLGLLSQRSLEALYKLLMKNLELQKDKQEPTVTPKAILYILCQQTHDDNYELATEMLLTIFPSLVKELKVEVIKYLSFFTKNIGYPIFQITATHDDIDLKLETIKSLERVISHPATGIKEINRKKQYIELLHQLTKDKNHIVAGAAMTASA